MYVCVGLENNTVRMFTVRGKYAKFFLYLVCMKSPFISNAFRRTWKQHYF